MNSKISKIEYFLPEKVLNNKEIENKFPGFTAEKISEKIGIDQRHIVSQNETALDLAYLAAEKLLKNYDRSVIDFIILCTQSPDYFLPTSACILQEKLKLKTSVGAFDFNLGCSGYIYGLAIAKGFISAGIASNVLLITSETYSKYINPLDKGNMTIFGDAGAATIIEQSTQQDIMEFVLGTDGKGFNNLIVPNGGSRNKYYPEAKELIDESGNVHTDNNLYMNGPEIFNFTIKNIPNLIQQVLNKTNIRFEEVDFFIFHQANKYMLDYLRKKIKIPEEKFYINMQKTGNTVSSTIPIALKDCIDQGVVKHGDKVLLAGFGVGYSWGATLINI